MVKKSGSEPPIINTANDNANVLNCSGFWICVDLKLEGK